MPVIAGKYLYIHMPKTGGVWMTKYLNSEHDGRLLPGHGHMPASEVPVHTKKGCELIGTARDPWGWYASWWHHALTEENTAKALRVYGNGSTKFADVMEGVLAPVRGRVPEKVSVIWDIKKPKAEQNNFIQRGIGLFSWTFNYLYGDMTKKIIDMKQMTEGLGALMGAHVDPILYPPSNTTKQRAKKKKIKSFATLYTPELVKMVWEADFALIQQLGYTKPFAPASAPLIQL